MVVFHAKLDRKYYQMENVDVMVIVKHAQIVVVYLVIQDLNLMELVAMHWLVLIVMKPTQLGLES